MMRIAGIEKESVVDGDGFRYVFFLQGCPHHCNGCHNPQTWDIKGGTDENVEKAFNDMLLFHSLNSGITISGGEPFLQYTDVKRLVELARKYEYTVWVYTGFTAEELFSMRNADIDYILDNIEMLVDGRFVLEKRDLSLVFRGSTNQRLLDHEALVRLRSEFVGKEKAEKGANVPKM